MVAANTLSISLSLALIMIGCVSAGSRGCQCYVKTSNSGPALAAFETDVGSGWFPGCNKKFRDRCEDACKEWVKNLAKDEDNRSSPVFHTEDGGRVIYSKLHCDGAKPFKDDHWRKFTLPKHCLDEVCWKPEKKSSSSSSGRSQGSAGPYQSLQVATSTFGGTFGGGNGGLAPLPFAAKRGVEPPLEDEDFAAFEKILAQHSGDSDLEKWLQTQH
jgi:hypothetical protein